MKILVTGGGGFIGSALVRKLVSEGHEVSTFSRNYYPEHLELGIRIFLGDLSNPKDVETACSGNDIVFHVAAKAGLWGSYDDFYSANVTGTENVIRSCLNCKVRKLIFTSSASIMFDGSDLINADETLPFPKNPISAYTATKTIAEQIVLKANSEELKTISLRPHLVWGPKDTQLTEGIIKRARSGRLRRIGKKDYLIDTTFIDNYIHAQILAMDKMKINPAVCGRAFLITNDEPVKIWDFINSIIASAGISQVKKGIPVYVAMIVATISEYVFRSCNLKSEPFITRFIVRELSAHHWFNITAAKELLGYSPHTNIIKGMELLRQSITEDANRPSTQPVNHKP